MPQVANSDFLYNSFISGLMTGVFNLPSNNINAVLVKKEYLAVANPNDGYKTLADILTYEATGTGYTSSGQALTNDNVWQDDYVALDGARYDSTDPSWPTSTVTASGIVLVKLGTLANGTDSPLIGFWSFGGDKSSSAGAFTVTVHASGWIELGPSC